MRPTWKSREMFESYNRRLVEENLDAANRFFDDDSNGDVSVSVSEDGRDNEIDNNNNIINDNVNINNIPDPEEVEVEIFPEQPRTSTPVPLITLVDSEPEIEPGSDSEDMECQNPGVQPNVDNRETEATPNLTSNYFATSTNQPSFTCTQTCTESASRTNPFSTSSNDPAYKRDQGTRRRARLTRIVQCLSQPGLRPRASCLPQVYSNSDDLNRPRPIPSTPTIQGQTTPPETSTGSNSSQNEVVSTEEQKRLDNLNSWRARLRYDAELRAKRDELLRRRSANSDFNELEISLKSLLEKGTNHNRNPAWNTANTYGTSLGNNAHYSGNPVGIGSGSTAGNTANYNANLGNAMNTPRNNPYYIGNTIGNTPNPNGNIGNATNYIQDPAGTTPNYSENRTGNTAYFIVTNGTNYNSPLPSSNYIWNAAGNTPNYNVIPPIRPINLSRSSSTVSSTTQTYSGNLESRVGFGNHPQTTTSTTTSPLVTSPATSTSTGTSTCPVTPATGPGNPPFVVISQSPPSSGTIKKKRELTEEEKAAKREKNKIASQKRAEKQKEIQEQIRAQEVMIHRLLRLTREVMIENSVLRAEDRTRRVQASQAGRVSRRRGHNSLRRAINRYRFTVKKRRA